MQRTSVELQRAKRRYKVLVREQESLVSSSSSDPVVANEIRKLEEAYPELKPPTDPNAVSRDNPLASPLPEKTKAAEDPGDAAEPGTTLATVTDVVDPPPISSQTRLRKSAPPSLLLQRKHRELRHRSISAEAPPRSVPESTYIPTRKADSYFMLMFALQLFNETYQKSMMSPLQLILIAGLSVTTAVAHCTVVDPSSISGALLSPSLLTLLVHANALCGLYLRRKQRFTVPKLIVYGVLDVLPSLALGVVSYNLGLIALEMHGFRRASYAC